MSDVTNEDVMAAMLSMDHGTMVDHPLLKDTDIKIPLYQTPMSHGKWRLSSVPAPPMYRGYHSGLQFSNPGERITVLRERNDFPDLTREPGKIWMSSNRAEAESQILPIKFARDNVMIMGFGMGVLVYNLLREFETTNRFESPLRVIEIDESIPTLIRKSVFRSPWIDTHVANALTYRVPANEPPVDYLDVDIWPQWDQQGIDEDLQRIYHNVKPKTMSWWSMELTFLRWACDKGIKASDLRDDHWEQWSHEIGIPIPLYEGAADVAVNAGMNSISW